ncbi:hypothetical protein BDF21DRAFT_430179 [Thamnidium elegans]|nr:hypothetical protein BDF21DRAFT_430179 [Thamnidium elegans]
MFSDDEDELELLRQYGDRDLHADDDEGHSSDMDSDLEDKIMSMVQFKKKTPIIEKPEITVAPPTTTAEKSTSQQKFSASQELQISEQDSDDDDEDDIGVPHDPSTPEDQLPVTRYINLNDKHYMDDEETDEEEAELNSKLQDLIDDQISKHQSKVRYTKPIRVCFACHQPGHDRRDCKLCSDCGGLRHADNRCVGARYCANCKMRGHNQIDCTNPRETKCCRICQISYHNALNCPSLLHVYENEVPARKQPTAYCYYCTAKGHYGDECSMLPKYLTTMPSVFSQLSLSSGSRFDPKKTMKNTASSFGTVGSHQRWSDSSRDNSPRGGNDRGGGGYHDHANKKRRYGEDDYSNRNRYNNNNDRYNSNKNDKKSYKSSNAPPNSYKDNNAGGKRHRTDLVEDSRSSGLDTFFVNEKKKKNFDYAGKSGNNNWKAVNSSLPQPTRSGTVNLNKKRQQQNYDGDFPRGGGSDELPRPSSSGIIDLTKSDSGAYSKRTSKYHGGYNRR